MPKIEWVDSLSVNNAEIDNQHKKWIGIHNKMHALLMGDIAKQGSRSVDILKEMLDYAREHFEFEEEYLRSIKYPEIIQHHRLHKDFDNQIYAYYRDMQEGKIVLNTEIISLIKDWLINHIANEDKKFALFSSKGK